MVEDILPHAQRVGAMGGDVAELVQRADPGKIGGPAAN
jgi:hypothetical protein